MLARDHGESSFRDGLVRPYGQDWARRCSAGTIRARDRPIVFGKATKNGYGWQLHSREQSMKSLDVVALAAMSQAAITVKSCAQAFMPL